MEVVSTLKVDKRWIPPDLDGVAVAGLLSDLASGVVGIIRNRVRTGRGDLDHAAFRKYTKPYALQRKKAGLMYGGTPRLRWSGELMAGLMEIANAGNRAEVGWLDEHLREIAEGLESVTKTGLAGRKFFGIRHACERLELGTVGNNFMAALVRRSRGR